jgi:hypothetical protein
MAATFGKSGACHHPHCLRRGIFEERLMGGDRRNFRTNSVKVAS